MNSSQISQQEIVAQNGIPHSDSLTLLPSKTINDPVHGFIQVEFMLMAIIDTPYFQRLRYLHQLGAGSYVFPGTSHTRFAHSIGTMHLAGKMAEQLREKDMEGTLNLTDRIILLIKAAGLVHDMGHGPLSHCFDGLFIPFIVETTQDLELKAKLQGWAHEDASEMMLEAAIKHAGLMDEDKYSDPLTADDVTFIKQLINLNEGEAMIYPEYAFAYDIVSNSRCSVDVDKFDYLERDCMNAGLRSAFRCDHVLHNCKVINQQVCFHKRVAWDIYELFHTRYSLFKQIYCHRKVKCIEYMITDAMKLADPVLHIATRIFSPEQYVKLDDTIVQQIEYYPVETITNAQHRADMEKAQAILRRLRVRDIYRYCAESLLPPAASKIKSTLKSSLSRKNIHAELKKLYPNSILKEEDLEIQLFSLNYANQDRNPIDGVFFYNRETDTTSHRIDPQKISLLIPSQFSEHYARIFIRVGDQLEAVYAARAFDVCLKKTFKEGLPGLTSLDHIELAQREKEGDLIKTTIFEGNEDQDDDDDDYANSFGRRHFSQAYMGDVPTSQLVTSSVRQKPVLSVIHSSIPHVQRSVTQRKLDGQSQNYNNKLSQTPLFTDTPIAREESLATPTKRPSRIQNTSTNAASLLALTSPDPKQQRARTIPATPQYKPNTVSSDSEDDDGTGDNSSDLLEISQLPSSNNKRKSLSTAVSVTHSQSSQTTTTTAAGTTKRQKTTQDSQSTTGNQNILVMMGIEKKDSKQ
jgi:HD superfamily phosphohydrolase